MTVTAVAGFRATGFHCGIKASGDPDLALVATDDGRPVTAAGVFTTNKMTAAPVVISKLHLARSGGRASAVILNSGNANAATGPEGDEHARRMAAAVAAALDCAVEEVLVCSTGLIGIPLPVERIEAAVPAVVEGLEASPRAGTEAAEAIRTTDTVRKETIVRADGFSVAGMAKGAAMLHPDMATMLAVLTTDAATDPEALAVALKEAVDATFNTITVDGATSTNDTVLVLANGRSGVTPDHASLTGALTQACGELARKMVLDAEGATKFVTVLVTGAADDDEARRAAKQIANSQLVKCSWYGADPYWGRIASELGSAGIEFDPSRLMVSYGGVVVAQGGVDADHDADEVARHMAGREIDLHAQLGLGTGQATVLTCDLTHAYIDENMGTS